MSERNNNLGSNEFKLCENELMNSGEYPQLKYKITAATVN